MPGPQPGPQPGPYQPPFNFQPQYPPQPNQPSPPFGFPEIPLDRFEKVSNSLVRLGGENFTGTNPFEVLGQAMNQRRS